MTELKLGPPNVEDFQIRTAPGILLALFDLCES